MQSGRNLLAYVMKVLPLPRFQNACSLLGLFFDPEEGGSMYFPKADKLIPDYPTPNPKDNRDYWVHALRLSSGIQSPRTR
jgi:hypothetical protein